MDKDKSKQKVQGWKKVNLIFLKKNILENDI